MFPFPLTQEPFDKRLMRLYKRAMELVSEVSIDAVIEKLPSLALETADAGFAALGLNDENGNLEKFLPVGMSRTEMDLIPHPPKGLGLIGELARANKTIRLGKISTHPNHFGFPPSHPRMTSFLGVPIRQGVRQIGQLYLTDKLGGPDFTDEDQALIETLAGFAGVAIVNARLYRDYLLHDRVLLRQNENLSMLLKMTSAIATSADVTEILDQGMTQLMDYLRLEVSEIYLKQEESKYLNLVLHKGSAVDNLWKPTRFKIGESTVGRSAASGNPIVLNLTENEYADLNPETKLKGLHQLAAIPLQGRRGLAGVLCVATSHPHPLEDFDVQFAQAIANWMATGVENVRLNIQDRRLAVLEERDRIGMDLHDGIIQSIYAVGLTLEHARLLLKENPDLATSRIEQSISDLNNTIRDIRAYILDLRPRQLKDEDLMHGIQRLVQEFHANTLVEVTFNGPKEGSLRLSEPQALALFHICQEALANIAKHARARRAEVTVWTTPERTLLEVRDDGRGFDMEKVKLTIGHGLSNMETRAVNAGGEVDISSEPEQGTTILAWVPFPEVSTSLIE